MMGIFRSRRWVAIAVAVVAPLSLSGCLILPGEFVSEMTVRKNGDFSFSYKGQIQLIGLANLLNSGMLDESSKAEFKATCWDESSAIENLDDAAADVAADDIADATSPVATYAVMRVTPMALQAADDAARAAGEAAKAAAEAAGEAAAAAGDEWQMSERECTSEETATQKKEWDEQQAASKKRDEEQKKMAAMLLGGIDPKDPRTITRFTREVERLAAWHKVEHIGNGVFMIDYSTKGRLADDFAFPVIPRYALGEPMIHITRWDNGRLRVEAPAFKTDPEMSVMTMLGAGSMIGMMGGGSAEKMPEPMAVKGAFTLTTDAQILANNTEDGAEESGGMAVLRWDIGPATYGAPMALLKLAQ
jgi:hypothetical protein